MRRYVAIDADFVGTAVHRVAFVPSNHVQQRIHGNPEGLLYSAECRFRGQAILLVDEIGQRHSSHTEKVGSTEDKKT